MDSNIAISVQNISKTFKIPHEKVSSLRGAAVSAFRRNTGYEEFKALDDVSFEVKKGEFFGIIGRNGSGKSTLLKVLAGIYQSDKGNVQIDGRISPFLELGIGFNPELSGRDNVYLNATVLGLTKKEIDEKFDSIVKFSELERFIDQKLKNYSSGMQVRLAFSVSIHANREILLMDEVLAVGDSNFASKCLNEFAKYKKQGKTVILVTHDIGTVQRYCDRAMLLRNGQILKIGDPDEVGNEYMYQNMSDEERRIFDEEKQEIGNAEKNIKKMKGTELEIEKKRIESEKRKLEEEKKNKVAEITKVEFLDEGENNKNVFKTGDMIVVRIYYSVRNKIEKPIFGIAIHTQYGIHIAGPNTRDAGFLIDNIEGSGHIDFKIESNPFFSGTYLFTVVLNNSEGMIAYDRKDKAYSFEIISGEKNQRGVIKIETSWNT